MARRSHPTDVSRRRVHELVGRIGVQVAAIAVTCRAVLAEYDGRYVEAYWAGRGQGQGTRRGTSDPTAAAVMARDLAYVRGALRRTERALRRASELLEEAEESLHCCWQETDPEEQLLIRAAAPHRRGGSEPGQVG